MTLSKSALGAASPKPPVPSSIVFTVRQRQPAPLVQLAAFWSRSEADSGAKGSPTSRGAGTSSSRTVVASAAAPAGADSNESAAFRKVLAAAILGTPIVLAVALLFLSIALVKLLNRI